MVLKLYLLKLPLLVVFLRKYIWEGKKRSRIGVKGRKKKREKSPILCQETLLSFLKRRIFVFLSLPIYMIKISHINVKNQIDCAYL